MKKIITNNFLRLIKQNETESYVLRFRFLLMPFLFTVMFFSLSAFKAIGQVAAWDDVSNVWTASTLNDGRSDYFQGEIIPFVYKLSGLINNGNELTVNITYDYYNNSGGKNAGGYAYITTYNTSRPSTLPFTGGSAPTIDNSFTGSGNTGVFFTQDADITSASAPGTTNTRTVVVKFIYTGVTGGSAYIYWGMYLSKRGTVTDLGTAPTNGAGQWPGGSLNLAISGNGPGGGVGNNPGSGGVVEGVISGTKYDDANKNGTKDNQEGIIAGVTIYLDKDNSGTLNAGDVSTVTDASGNYLFGDLLPATYIVREVVPTGYIQTEPASSATPAYAYSIILDAANFNFPDKNFGNFTCPTTKPTISTTTSTTFCDGGSVLLTSSSASGNQWNDNYGNAISGATGQTYNATANGSYTVTVTLLGCPNTSDPETVTVNPLTTTGSVTTSICDGQSYTWPANGVTYSTAQTNLTYKVDCNTATLNLTVNPLPTFTSATVTTPIACKDGTATVTIIATGGTAPISYTFNGVTNATGIFTGVSAGNGKAYSITDANSCGPVTGTINVTQPPAISFTSAGVTTPILCNGGTATVTIVAHAPR